jgi:hypothetical protein
MTATRDRQRYAARTTVAPSATVAEIERTLKRYGAEAFAYGTEERRAVVGFKVGNRAVRFVLEFPAMGEYARTPTGKARTDRQMKEQYEYAVRQRWRALLLVVKAKLEAVASGIVDFEREFLPYLVLADGSTVGDTVVPTLSEIASSGDVFAALSGARKALPPG